MLEPHNEVGIRVRHMCGSMVTDELNIVSGYCCNDWALVDVHLFHAAMDGEDVDAEAHMRLSIAELRDLAQRALVLCDEAEKRAVHVHEHMNHEFDMHWIEGPTPVFITYEPIGDEVDGRYRPVLHW